MCEGEENSRLPLHSIAPCLLPLPVTALPRVLQAVELLLWVNPRQTLHFGVKVCPLLRCVCSAWAWFSPVLISFVPT